MKRRILVGALAGAVPAAAKGIRERFIGIWKLVSCERRNEDGRVEYPYGKMPIGRLTYDAAGRMSAQLMAPGRRSSVAPGMNLILGKASVEELREAVGGFASYYGTFDVDEGTSTVIHHVQAALVPSWVGTDLRRSYTFNSNRLSLTAKLPGAITELIWERD